MQKTKKREWVKTAAIIFLSVLLVLTFFSNTIRNHSLPEVAAQYVESGSINAKIRGSGAVAANEAYEVMLAQTRKIESVLVRVGDEVKAGDPLFKLESTESDELKTAEQSLRDMQLSYQKSLMSQGNEGSTENHDIQKKREAYNDALRIYNLYSTMSPIDAEIAMKDAERDLKKMQQEQTKLQNELTELTSGSAYTKANKRIEELTAEISSLKAAIEENKKQIDPKIPDVDVLNSQIAANKTELEKAQAAVSQLTKEQLALRDEFLVYTNNEPLAMKHCANDPRNLLPYIQNSPNTDASLKNIEHATKVCDAYNAVTTAEEAVTELQTSQGELEGNLTKAQAQTQFKAAIQRDEASVAQKENELRAAKQEIAGLDSRAETLKSRVNRATEMIAEQQAVVENYTAASTAAATLKTAQEALEDAIFQANLGDTNNLDIQASKEAIELQKKEVEKLKKEADGQEVTAKVSGTISAINVTAGASAGAEQPIATITVADRGFVIKVPVTVEQARQVHIGDTAEVTNYYSGDIKATLENITVDPDSGGKGKLLMFRITGEGVEAGTNLTLSIGQKSANYDCLIPKSAIRSDSNGSFVLVVTAKSSPLGNRYIATRADIQVLAEDDTKAAVSGLAYGDFVITTSTKPLEAGAMVRLVENG